jgi:DNA-binding response OmpR family regulator
LAEENLPTVLCIENNTANLMLMHNYLGEMGYLVIPAFDGREGFYLAASKHPQVIVLDSMLPGIGSWEVLRQLKTDPATSVIPVIVAGVEDEKSLGLSLGADEYLVKPVNPSRFLEVIRHATRFFGDRVHSPTAGNKP